MPDAGIVLASIRSRWAADGSVIGRNQKLAPRPAKMTTESKVIRRRESESVMRCAAPPNGRS